MNERLSNNLIFQRILDFFFSFSISNRMRVPTDHQQYG